MHTGPWSHGRASTYTAPHGDREGTLGQSRHNCIPRGQRGCDMTAFILSIPQEPRCRRNQHCSSRASVCPVPSISLPFPLPRLRGAHALGRAFCFALKRKTHTFNPPQIINKIFKIHPEQGSGLARAKHQVPLPGANKMPARELPGLGGCRRGSESGHNEGTLPGTARQLRAPNADNALAERFPKIK